MKKTKEVKEISIQQLSDEQVRAYIKSNTVEHKDHPHLRVVTKELKVWKKTHSYDRHSCIVALRIPVGAILYASMMKKRYSIHHHGGKIDYRKMRCDSAIVEKQFIFRATFGAAKGKWFYTDYKEIKTTFSSFDYDFKYRTGRTVKPRYNFDNNAITCESGIHFFVNLNDAIVY